MGFIRSSVLDLRRQILVEFGTFCRRAWSEDLLSFNVTNFPSNVADVPTVVSGWKQSPLKKYPSQQFVLVDLVTIWLTVYGCDTDIILDNNLQMPHSGKASET